jgi:hypothetical protein
MQLWFKAKSDTWTSASQLFFLGNGALLSAFPFRSWESPLAFSGAVPRCSFQRCQRRDHPDLAWKGRSDFGVWLGCRAFLCDNRDWLRLCPHETSHVNAAGATSNPTVTFSHRVQKSDEFPFVVPSFANAAAEKRGHHISFVMLPSFFTGKTWIAKFSLYIDGVLFQEEESTAWKLDKVDRTSLLLIGDPAVALSAELFLVAMYAKALTAAEVRYSLRAGPSRRLPKRGRRLRGFVPLNRTARAMRLLWPAVRVAVQPQLCPRRLSRVVQRTAIPRAIQGTTLPGSTVTRR